MNSVAGSHGIFDPKWGVLVSTLQEEGLSPQQIECAKNELAEVILNPEKPVSERARDLYAMVFPKNRKEMISAIKNEILAFTEKKIKEVLSDSTTDVQQMLTELQQPCSFIAKKIQELRRLGVSDIDTWYFHHTDFTYSASIREERAKAVVNEIVSEFFAGFPTSFPTMAHLLVTRKIGHASTTHLPSFPDVSNSIQLLKRLADLGDRAAQQELSSVYEWNTIGDDESKTSSNLTMRERIDGLRMLALAGHKYSQYRLGSVCFHRSIGHDAVPDNIGGLPENMRKKYLSELWDKKDSHSFYRIQMICSNILGEIAVNSQVESRLTMLYEMAQKGNETAFRKLIEAYIRNRLDENDKKESLNLTEAERLDKIFELRKCNPDCFDVYMADA